MTIPHQGESVVLFILTVLGHIEKLYEGGNYTTMECDDDTLDVFPQNLDRHRAPEMRKTSRPQSSIAACRAAFEYKETGLRVLELVILSLNVPSTASAEHVAF